MLLVAHVLFGPMPGTDSDQRILARSPSALDSDCETIAVMASFGNYVYRDPLYQESFACFPLEKNRVGLARSTSQGTGARGHRILTHVMALPQSALQALDHDPFPLLTNDRLALTNWSGDSCRDEQITEAQLASLLPMTQVSERLEPLRRFSAPQLRAILDSYFRKGAVAIVTPQPDWRVVQALLWLVPVRFRSGISFSSYLSSTKKRNLTIALIPGDARNYSYYRDYEPEQVIDAAATLPSEFHREPLIEFLVESVIHQRWRELAKYLEANNGSHGINPFLERGEAAVKYAVLMEAVATGSDRLTLEQCEELVALLAEMKGKEEEYRRCSLEAARSAFVQGELPKSVAYLQASMIVAIGHCGREVPDLVDDSSEYYDLLSRISVVDPFALLYVVAPEHPEFAEFLGWFTKTIAPSLRAPMPIEQEQWLALLLQTPAFPIAVRFELLCSLREAIVQSGKTKELLTAIEAVQSGILILPTNYRARLFKVWRVVQLWLEWGELDRAITLYVRKFLLQRSRGSENDERAQLRSEIKARLDFLVEKVEAARPGITKELANEVLRAGDDWLDRLISGIARAAEPARSQLQKPLLDAERLKSIEIYLRDSLESHNLERFTKKLAEFSPRELTTMRWLPDLIRAAVPQWVAVKVRIRYEIELFKVLVGCLQYIASGEIPKLVTMLKNATSLENPLESSGRDSETKVVDLKYELIESLLQHVVSAGRLAGSALKILARWKFIYLLSFYPDKGDASVRFLLELAALHEDSFRSLLIAALPPKPSFLPINKIRVIAAVLANQKRLEVRNRNVLVRSFTENVSQIKKREEIQNLFQQLDFTGLSEDELHKLLTTVMALLQTHWDKAPVEETLSFLAWSGALFGTADLSPKLRKLLVKFMTQSAAHPDVLNQNTALNYAQPFAQLIQVLARFDTSAAEDLTSLLHKFQAL